MKKNSSEQVYEEKLPITNNLDVIWKNGKCGIMNKRGVVLLSCIYSDINWVIENKHLIINKYINDNTCLYGIFDVEKEKMILECSYFDIILETNKEDVNNIIYSTFDNKIISRFSSQKNKRMKPHLVTYEKVYNAITNKIITEINSDQLAHISFDLNNKNIIKSFINNKGEKECVLMDYNGNIFLQDIHEITPNKINGFYVVSSSWYTNLYDPVSKTFIFDKAPVKNTVISQKNDYVILDNEQCFQVYNMNNISTFIMEGFKLLHVLFIKNEENLDNQNDNVLFVLKNNNFDNYCICNSSEVIIDDIKCILHIDNNSISFVNEHRILKTLKLSEYNNENQQRKRNRRCIK